jgi:hypothetical protein
LLSTTTSFTSERMKQYPSVCTVLLVAVASSVLAAVPLFGQSPVIILFPKDKQSFEIQFPDGYKTAFKPDGSCVAVGPKAVIALISMEKAKDAATARNGLPDLTKSFFLRSLHFRDLNVLGTEDTRIQRMVDEADGAPASVLRASGKNSDGNEMAITATAFPWQHRHYVVFTVAKPGDKDQTETELKGILSSVSEINDD